MLKRFKNYIVNIWKLSAPINHRRLMLLGFDYSHPYYILENLAIELKIETGYYFYYDPEGNLHRIKTMRDVAGLVYGPTEYGK